MSERLLILEDDKEIGELIQKYLNSHGYSTLLVQSAYEAAGYLQNEIFDLALLDIMLPDWNGFDLLKSIRQTTDLAVIFITARDNEDDKVKGLELGADDYITKPFAMRELLARIKALLRRYHKRKTQVPQIMEFPNLHINLSTYSITAYGKKVKLTETEFKLLTTLASAPEQVFTKEQLARLVWPDLEIVEDNTIMVTIRRLRKKIEYNAEKPQIIQTLWGIGYKFHEEE